MQRSTDEHLRELVRKQIDCQETVHTWEDVSKAGVIGLVATEIPEFFAKPGTHRSWRPWAFAASSISVVAGAVMGWVKQKQADKMRKEIAEIEYGYEPAGQWGVKVTAEQNAASPMTK